MYRSKSSPCQLWLLMIGQTHTKTRQRLQSRNPSPGGVLPSTSVSQSNTIFLNSFSLCKVSFRLNEVPSHVHVVSSVKAFVSSLTLHSSSSQSPHAFTPCYSLFFETDEKNYKIRRRRVESGVCSAFTCLKRKRKKV